jgi:hypothetical protein
MQRELREDAQLQCAVVHKAVPPMNTDSWAIIRILSPGAAAAGITQGRPPVFAPTDIRDNCTPGEDESVSFCTLLKNILGYFQLRASLALALRRLSHERSCSDGATACI